MTSSDIGYLLNRAARRFRLDFAASLTHVGLRPQQAAALMAIGRSGETRLTPTLLADAIDIDAPTASGLLNRLERDGWIISISNPDDGRSHLITLTEQAANVLPSVFQSAGEVSTQAVACLTADEAQELERLLSLLCEHNPDRPHSGGRA